MFLELFMSSDWVVPDFDCAFRNVSTQGNKRKRDVSWRKEARFLQHEKKGELWVESYKPKNASELAVHKRKVEDVRECMLSKLTSARKGGVILLTGPPGCGKTACITVLARELGLELQEWINPTEVKQEWTPMTFHQEDYVPVNQTQQFKDFLLKVNKYPSLNLGSKENKGSNKLLLVEEYPNAFFKEPKEFENILRRLCCSIRCLVVFIASDDTKGSSNNIQRMLFPKEMLQDLSIQVINFNPVAPTAMVKALSRISSSAAPSHVQSLAELSGGDLRAAINALQFSSIKSDTNEISFFAPSEKGRKRTKTKQKRKTEKDGMIGDKDETLCLFRALGRIFYAKREETMAEEERLPKHLKSLERCRLQVNPEHVHERAPIMPDGFCTFLEENYLGFFTKIEDVARAIDYISDSDFLMSEWMSKASLESCAASVACRGIIHSNTQPVKGSFRAFHRPQFYQARKTQTKRMAEASVLFATENCSKQELMSEMIPYRGLLSSVVPLAASQASLVRELSQFRRSAGSYRPSSETLKEKDFVAEDAEEDINISLKENAPPVIQVQKESDEEEEEMNCIEEFSD